MSWRRNSASATPSAAGSSSAKPAPAAISPTRRHLDILAWPTDRAAYGRLCRLLTAGKRRAEKGDCAIGLRDLLEWGEGQILGVMPEQTKKLPSRMTEATERRSPN
jgi:DNA polymerase III alpha subunit